MEKKKLLKVTLSLDGEQFANCSYLELDPYALTTARKFTFKNLKISKKVSLRFGDKIKINVLYSCRYKRNKQHLYAFKILIIDIPISIENDWWVYGLIETEYKEEYRQGVIDVFNNWQNGVSLEWSNLPTNAPIKEDYLYACLMYSSLSTTVIEREFYSIDMNSIKVESDFLYYASNTFLGDRAYMGYDLYTFEDCLLELFKYQGYFDNKRILFLNTTHFQNPEVARVYIAVKKIFEQFKFLLVEN